MIRSWLSEPAHGRATSPRPRVVIQASEAAEFVLSLATISHTTAIKTLEVGPSWISGTERRAGSDLIEAVRALSGESRYSWIKLLHFAIASSQECGVEGLIAGLRNADAREVCRHLVGYYDPDVHRLISGEVLGRAVDGDAAALDMIRGTTGLPFPVGLLESDPSSTVTRLIQIITAWSVTVWPMHADLTSRILKRDVLDKQSLRCQWSFEELVTTTTRGVRWPTLRPDIRTVFFVPTYIGRPWVAHTEAFGALIIAYPVADASLGPASEIPTRRFARLAVAVRSPHRSGIVGELSTKRRTLPELAERLGVGADALLQDMLNLRAAGLVTVDADTHQYQLHSAEVSELGQLMGAYLESSPTADSTRSGWAAQSLRSRPDS